MCGRFVSASPPDEIARYFDADPAVDEQLLDPNYNVAPTDDVYAVLETDGSDGSDGARRLEALRWGLVPWWADSPAVGSRMINARAETLAVKNAFAPAYRARRCLIPADGFYEWAKVGAPKTKQPMYIHRADGERLVFAGLWETWRDPNDPQHGQLRSCTIVTTTANETMSPVHDRMPAVLASSAWDQWLDPRDANLDRLGILLVPAPPSLLTMHPVSTEVNSVRNNGATLVEPVEPVEPAEPADTASPPSGEIYTQGSLL